MENKEKVSIKDKVSDILEGFKSNPKKLIIPIGVIVILVFFINGFKAYRANQLLAREQQSEVGTQQSYTAPQSSSSSVIDGTELELFNQDLINKQPDLVRKYGQLSEGFVWDYDGAVLSLGDKSYSAEEAMYAYINGIRTLDFSSAQRFSRNSSVISRYLTFYDDSTARYQRYEDNFYRNMYTTVLKSIQPGAVTDIAVFQENKQIFTINLEMIDLSSKDFWEKDKEEIYRTLYMYSQTEEDQAKADQYIYEYIMDYFNAPDVAKKVVTVNLTVEKDPTLDTGWLVTIDKDIDNYCYYVDGTVINKYIMNQFRNEGREQIREELRGEN